MRKNMSLSHGILGFLMYNKMSGYDLAKIFNSSIKMIWYAQNSHIYLELKNLQKKGYVTSEEIIQHDKPNKNLYEITQSGKDEFYTWLCKTDFSSMNMVKNSLLMNIFFTGNLDIAASKAKFHQFIEEVQQKSIDLPNAQNDIDFYKSSQNPLDALHWQFCADFGNKYTQMRLEWAKECLQKLEQFEQVEKSKEKSEI